MEKICVAVRVRPSVSTESFNGAYWNVEDNRISLHRLHGTPISGLSYAFGTHLYLYIFLISLKYMRFCIYAIYVLVLVYFRFFEIFLYVCFTVILIF